MSPARLSLFAVFGYWGAQRMVSVTRPRMIEWWNKTEQNNKQKSIVNNCEKMFQTYSDSQDPWGNTRPAYVKINETGLYKAVSPLKSSTCSPLFISSRSSECDSDSLTDTRPCRGHCSLETTMFADAAIAGAGSRLFPLLHIMWKPAPRSGREGEIKWHCNEQKPVLQIYSLVISLQHS